MAEVDPINGVAKSFRRGDSKKIVNFFRSPLPCSKLPPLANSGGPLSKGSAQTDGRGGRLKPKKWVTVFEGEAKAPPAMPLDPMILRIRKIMS